MPQSRLPLTVKMVMTPFPEAIDVDAPLAVARRFMRERRVRHLPVTAEGRLAGILTDRDIKLVLGPDFDCPPERELAVRDAFQPDAEVVDLQAHLSAVLELMVERHIGSVLVTRRGKLAGIFTTTDVCRAFAERLRAEEGRNGHPGPSGNDAA